MNEFWISFWSNLASSAIIAVIFGAAISFLITRWINKLERKEQRLQEKKLETQRAIELVNVLNNHVNEFKPKLDNWMTIILEEAEKGDYVAPLIFEQIPRYDVTFWEMYKNSGELTKYFSPKTIISLSKFFGYLVDARKIMDWIFENWDDSYLSKKKSKKVETYAQLVNEDFVFANKEYPELIEQLRRERTFLEHPEFLPKKI